jgi:acid phosphatase family membrane protein YuiD
MHNIADGFKLLFSNPTFQAGVSGWFCAQFIKTVITLLRGKVKNFKEVLELLIFRTGGMPSSHSALVMAVCTSIAFKHGINSDLFALSLCFSLVVIRDAFGVRRSSGLQAKTINEIGNELNLKSIIKYKQIKEIQGHTPLEVLVGTILGIVMGCAFNLL